MASRNVQRYKNSLATPGTSMEPGSSSSPASVVKVNPGADQALQRLFDQAKFTKNPAKGTMPSSFYTPKKPSHSRGPSAGNSPLGGSSDDGLGSNSLTTLNTLSPQSVSGYPVNHHPVHKKHPSAPDVLMGPNSMASYDNHMRHQPQQPYHHGHSNSFSALPPAHQHTPVHKQARSVGGAFSGSYGDTSTLHPDMNSTMGSNLERSKSLPQTSFMMDETAIRPLQPPNVDRLGPLPHNWEYREDDLGNGYYVDHSTKTTTWYDPRQPEHLQANEIMRLHSSYGQGYFPGQSDPNVHPQQQQHFPMPNQDYNASYQRVQQLDAERSALQERQAQLMQSGLLQPENSPRPFPTHSPMMTGQEFQQYPRMESGNQQHLSSPYVGHGRTVSGDSGHVIDSGMEVEYSHGMAHDQYVMTDINPHEFDKYLQLGDNKHHHQHQIHQQQQRIPPYQ